MTAVTRCVFDTEGIVINFQGDAIFACWGAPVAVPDHALGVARTAQAILRRIPEHRAFLCPDAPRGALSCGMGLASGPALAGNVGVAGQIKYDVIGSCVNVASRLEGLTKYFRVPCLLAGETRRVLPADLPCRRIARVRPVGLEQPIDLYDFVLPQEWGGSGLQAHELAVYERAMAAFEASRMEEADALRAVPLEDLVRRFLNLQVERFLFEGVPADWDGVITFAQK